MDASLEKTLELAGGPAALGKLLGISSQAVSQWRRIPPLQVIPIERALEGRITRYEMRPDLYPRDGEAA